MHELTEIRWPLMADVVYIAAAMRAPIVMALGYRALSGPINMPWSATGSTERGGRSTGSTAGTVEDAVDELRAQEDQVGLLEAHAFRPFPAAAVADALAGVEHAIVLDRADSPGGAAPPLLAETAVALHGNGVELGLASGRAAHLRRLHVRHRLAGVLRRARARPPLPLRPLRQRGVHEHGHPALRDDPVRREHDGEP